MYVNKISPDFCFSHWVSYSGSEVCPECGHTELEYNTLIVLPSNPPQTQLRCTKCNHHFCSGYGTNEDIVLDKIWEHDQSILGIPQVSDWPPGPQPNDWPPSPQPNDWLESRNWSEWLKEDFLDLLNDYPDLYEMSKDEVEKTVRALRSTAQDFLDKANSLESQADLLARYLNEKV